MDPFLLCLFVAAWITHIGKELPYAMRSKTSPRMQMKLAEQAYRHKNGGRKPGWAGTGRYSARSFFAHAWHDAWDTAHQRRLEYRTNHEHKRQNGELLRQRTARGLAAAATATGQGVKTAWDRVHGRPANPDSTQTNEPTAEPQAHAVPGAIGATAFPVRSGQLPFPADLEAQRAAAAFGTTATPAAPQDPAMPIDSSHPVVVTPRGFNERNPLMRISVPANESAARPCSSCGVAMTDDHDSVSVDEGDGSAMIDTRCDRCGIHSWRSWEIPDAEYRNLFGHPFGEGQEEPPEDAPGPHQHRVRVHFLDGRMDTSTVTAADRVQAESQALQQWSGATGVDYLGWIDPSTEPKPEEPAPAGSTTPELRGTETGLATVTPITRSSELGGNTTVSTPTVVTDPTGGEIVDPESAMAFTEAMHQLGTELITTIEHSIASVEQHGVSGVPVEKLSEMLECAQTFVSSAQQAHSYFENHAQIQDVVHSDDTVGGGEYLGIGH